MPPLSAEEHVTSPDRIDFTDKKGLVAGIANAKAEPNVRPLAEELASPIIVLCGVRDRDNPRPCSSAWLDRGVDPRSMTKNTPNDDDAHER